jgi:hypothetical protein
MYIYFFLYYSLKLPSELKIFRYLDSQWISTGNEQKVSLLAPFSSFHITGPDIWVSDNTEAVSRKPFCSRDLAAELFPNAFKETILCVLNANFKTNSKIWKELVHFMMLQ